MNYVIIGNSVSAVAAIEAIREHDKLGKIQVISDESYFNYSRPLISYFLGKKVSLEKMPFRDKDFYEENKVDLMLNKKAKKIDIKKRMSVKSSYVPGYSYMKSSNPWYRTSFP